MDQPFSGAFADLLQAIQSLQTRREPLARRLQQIEQNRNATAPQIYEKVRSETEAQLGAIESEAAERRSEAANARTQLLQRKQDLAGHGKQLTDELEELRFRNTLGEFTPEAFQRVEAEKSAALQAVADEANSIESAERLLGAFLGESAAAPAAAAPAPAAPAPAAPAAAAPPPPAPRSPAPSFAPAPSEAPSEMEALFGSRPVAAPKLAAPSATTDETTQDIESAVSFDDLGKKADESRPVLVVKAKDRGEDIYDLGHGQTLVGRAPENDIILLEESVSRRHARLSIEPGQATLEDLGSANGSYVNGERLRPRDPKLLRDNDVIKFGQLMALFRVKRDD